MDLAAVLIGEERMFDFCIDLLVRSVVERVACRRMKVGVYMGRYHAIDIARWFIHRNDEDVKNGEDEKMTLLKLLKLLCYAEGCSLALNKGSLFSEKIVAWEHGPVVEEVWRKFDDAYNLDVAASDMEGSLSRISDEDDALLEDVYAVFGKYSALGLRNKTHAESPWLDATHGGMRFNSEIPRQSIVKCFKENYVKS